MPERLLKNHMGMRHETYVHFKKRLFAQLVNLSVSGYWDTGAIKAYRTILTKMAGEWWFLSMEELSFLMDRQLEETKKIGSKMYSILYLASQLKAMEKALLPIRQLGGYIDGNGMLQLNKIKYEIDGQQKVIRMRREKGEYGFSPGMYPGCPFLSQYAFQVQKAYGKKGINKKSIHQFRMYLDLHNITYVRHNYKLPGMTDEEALKRFVQKKLKGKKLLREGARLHNKYPEDGSYIDYKKGDENKKRLTPDRHSEFIIDRKGRFVSQWNVLEADKRGRINSLLTYYENKYGGCEEKWEKMKEQILDTESFNYASAGGKDKMHTALDVEPPKEYDTDIRKTIARGWKSPVSKKGDRQSYDYGSDKGDEYSAGI